MTKKTCVLFQRKSANLTQEVLPYNQLYTTIARFLGTWVACCVRSKT
jgi:hypothetical protein